MPLYYKLKKDFQMIKKFMTCLLNAFDLFAQCGIVHSDVKTDNILIEFDQDSNIKSLKFIDFGSAFLINETNSLHLSTPEYLAPEILKYLSERSQFKQGETVESIVSRSNPWSFDMWSLGALLLEIITGFPLWLSMKG